MSLEAESDDSLTNPFAGVPAVKVKRHRGGRADVKAEGSRPRLSQNPAMQYDWQRSELYVDLTEDAVEQVEAHLCEQQCGKGMKFKPFRRPLKYKVRADGSEVSDRYCPFNVECGCPFKLRRIRHADASLGSYVYSLEFSNVAHVDHEIPLQRDLQRKQLSRQTKALMDSPTKLRAGPRALVSSMRSQVQLSSHEAELVKRERVRLIK